MYKEYTTYMENNVITKVVEKTIHITHLNDDLFYIEPEFGNVEMTDFKYTPSDNDKDPIINIDVEEDTNQKELIEQDLDSQPDDTQLDEFISTLEYPEVIPSCLTFYEYIEKELGLIERQINDLRLKYETVYIQDYRKVLREWWFNRKNKLNNELQSNTTI